MSLFQKVEKQPAVLLILTVILLILLSYIPDGQQIFMYKAKKIDLFMDVHKDQAEQPQSFIHNENVINEASIINAGWILDALFVADKPEMRETAAPQAQKIQKIENPGALKNFLDAVKQSGSKKIRIAHYGDSALEGDNISSDLRKNLQSKYGGNGVGIVGITPMDKQFRTTTDLTWSPDWKSPSLISSNPEKLPLGINGFIYQPVANSWVRMAASGRNNSVKYFTNVRVLYATDKNCTIKYSFEDKPEVNAELKAGKGVSELMLPAKAKVKSVKITVVNPSKTFIYGLSLEEENGLYLDNFPLRGNSGVSLRDLDNTTLKEFDKLLGYKLIIFNFGLNIANPDAKDFNWYESSMEKVINQYKEAFPQASFLIVSVQDKGAKKGSAFVTEPSVPKLVDAQKRIAHKTGVAFWNLYEAMGGMNSMSSWVDQGFAEKDYTHLKLTGSKKVADLLTDALLGAQ